MSPPSSLSTHARLNLIAALGALLDEAATASRDSHTLLLMIQGALMTGTEHEIVDYAVEFTMDMMQLALARADAMEN